MWGSHSFLISLELQGASRHHTIMLHDLDLKQWALLSCDSFAAHGGTNSASHNLQAFVCQGRHQCYDVASVCCPKLSPLDRQLPFRVTYMHKRRNWIGFSEKMMLSYSHPFPLLTRTPAALPFLNDKKLYFRSSQCLLRWTIRAAKDRGSILVAHDIKDTYERDTGAGEWWQAHSEPGYKAALVPRLLDSFITRQLLCHLWMLNWQRLVSR